MSSIARATLLGVPFAILGALQALPFLASREQSQAGAKATYRAGLVNEHTLGKLPTGWEVLSSKRVTRDSADAEGHYSVIFDVQRVSSESQVRISLDYPFIMRWHNLTGCYEFFGWQCLKEEILNASSASNWPYVKVRLRSVDHQEATLFFSIFDASGVGIEPPEGQLVRAIWHRFQKKTNILSPVPSYFQVQVFATGVFESTDEAKLLELFLHLREVVRSEVVGVRQSEN